MEKRIKDKKTVTGWDIIKEIEDLEPKNMMDYIFKGSGLNQFLKKYGIMPNLPIPKR